MANIILAIGLRKKRKQISDINFEAKLYCCENIITLLCINLQVFFMHSVLRRTAKGGKLITAPSFLPLLGFMNCKGSFPTQIPFFFLPFFLKLNIQVSSPSTCQNQQAYVITGSKQNLINCNGGDFFLVVFKPIRWQQETSVSLKTLERKSLLLSSATLHCQ